MEKRGGPQRELELVHTQIEEANSPKNATVRHYAVESMQQKFCESACSSVLAFIHLHPLIYFSPKTLGPSKLFKIDYKPLYAYWIAEKRLTWEYIV